MSKYTKETLIPPEFIHPPIKENTKIFFSHFSRYWYASKVLNIQKSDIVLDASCGVGYGTYSIAQKAKHTIGLDINKDYIKMAQDIYDEDNISFMTYDDYYNNSHSKVDKIICIETWEHVPKVNSSNFTNNLISCLKLGGDMFVTVPLADDKPNSINIYHLNEPSLQTIYDHFSKHFEKIDIEIDNFTNCFNQECQYCFLILKNKKG